MRCVSFLLCRVEKLGADALLVKVLGIAGFGRVAAFDTTIECFGPFAELFDRLAGQCEAGANLTNTKPAQVPAEPTLGRPHTLKLNSRDFKDQNLNVLRF